ncbi:MAG: hypothetical protein A2Z18_05180 [Armatimonadetes bacterium RBG_16_58_9]|nr:MAG: hypothetical protein A2Z18_05180 [Armatimonadetes bacterium RBG_16_58_9]
MTSRERLLIALENGKPDRLPAQVHNWMPYYLNNYLDGCDQYEAYSRFGLDYVIYVPPGFACSDKSLANWQTERIDLGSDGGGGKSWVEKTTTPEGTLTVKMAANEFTTWITEPLVETKADFELFRKYFPVPDQVDFTSVIEARDRVADNGIVRGAMWGYGQPGVWQSFCYLVGTQEAIYYAMDEPEWVHYVLRTILDMQLPVIEKMKGIPYDLIENGGGAASNTVISPAFHREFCLPHDREQHDAIHAAVGCKIVYHLCGGLMQLLETVVDNHADGLETMTPPGMGGDCDLAEAARRVGDKLFFIGGFDQNDGFEKGTPERAKQLVYQCHSACPNGGYICSPSDHFFFGDPANVRAFADAAKDCVY